ncbi:sensor protein KdpD [Clostridium algidicarnis]|uniref:Two-component system sensor histidine kinase KdpD n=2 Tax=Clostridium algidicarnis TaxID=37659 RepID=A0A2S6FZ24_9CLOT|nr:universal stress protein [Clostridium algidicarnis]MBU3220207.1 universal stress protein [Clostridium algidicarnis]PPK48882.1 two-component system sensor histidine kinase KdpD [Clostridium algidicarnis DSM 15099]
MSSKFKRLSPEEALEKANSGKRGSLKIFLGYAPGVGKTYSMLNEANRRLFRQEDVVAGCIETHGRIDTKEQIGGLKIIAKKKIEYNGRILEEMDTETIIKLKPDAVLVDELAHTNVPGSKNKKRFEDVEEMLSEGIDVVTTVNIQHLESLNDVIRQITGIKVRETIPDSVVEHADEVVVIDVTPDALQNRLKRGDIYKTEIDRALKNFFRKGNLNALREIALRQVAEEVDEDLAEYMKEHEIRENWHTAERVMICISSSDSSKKLIRRGARIAKRYKCEWLVVDVICTSIFYAKSNPKDEENLNNNRALARQLGAEVFTLKGKSISRELINFAFERHITQIIIGNSNRSTLQTMLRGSTVYKILKYTNDIEVHVIPN